MKLINVFRLLSVVIALSLVLATVSPAFAQTEIDPQWMLDRFLENGFDEIGRYKDLQNGTVPVCVIKLHTTLPEGMTWNKEALAENFGLSLIKFTEVTQYSMRRNGTDFYISIRLPPEFCDGNSRAQNPIPETRPAHAQHDDPAIGDWKVAYIPIPTISEPNSVPKHEPAINVPFTPQMAASASNNILLILAVIALIVVVGGLKKFA